MSSHRLVLASVFCLACCLGTPGLGFAEVLYWSDLGPDTIKRANRDGSGIDLIYTSPTIDPSSEGVQGLAIDAVNKKVYWSESYDIQNTSAILRANLDGSNLETIIVVDFRPTHASLIQAVAVDPVGGHIYWTDNTDFAHDGFINRANLDGSDPVTLGVDFKPTDLELDLLHGKLYYIDTEADEIIRMNLDGSSPQVVLTGTFDVRGLALDSENDFLYFSDNGAGVAQIKRASLDGTGVTPVITTGLNDVRGMVVDPQYDKLYWVDLGDNVIQRANLDGSHIENVVTAGLTLPNNITLLPEPTSIGLLLMGAVAVLLGHRTLR